MSKIKKNGEDVNNHANDIKIAVLENTCAHIEQTLLDIKVAIGRLDDRLIKSDAKIDSRFIYTVFFIFASILAPLVVQILNKHGLL